MRFCNVAIIVSVGLMSLVLGCARVQHIVREEPVQLRMDTTAASASIPAIEAIIQPYREKLAVEMGEVIGFAPVALTKNDGESTMGNWVADAVLQFAERHTGQDLDIGICNSGGMRIPAVPAGEVTRRHMFELMPFDNYLVIMELEGKVLLQLFDHMAAREGWPISAGVSYRIIAGQARDIRLDGQPVDVNKSYSVVLSDYLAEGGGSCTFLEELPYQNLNVYYREALIHQAIWLTQQQLPVTAGIEGRIQL